MMMISLCSIFLASSAYLVLLSSSALSVITPVHGFSVSTTTTGKSRTLLHTFDRFLTRLQEPEKQLQDHIYLSGNYAPVSEEHVSVPVEVVEGYLPRGLNGMFSRNGPNPTEQLSKRYHWFDGHAMLHNLRFQDGKASYTNQFVPCPRLEIEREFGEDYFPTLGEYDGILGLVKILFHANMVSEQLDDLKQTSSPNTACLMYRNRFYCLNEGGLPFECRIMPSGRLQPVGHEYFNGALDYPVSAHPLIDHNGDLLFHSYTTNLDMMKRDGPIKVGRFSAESGKVENYFGPRFNEEHTSFAHSLLFTERYMIVWDCSVHFDKKALFDGGSWFRSNSDFNLRFGIMDKKKANKPEDVKWFDTGAPGGIVHALNSWEEEDGTIVIWTPFCDDLNLDLDTEELNVFNMVEFRLDPIIGEVTKQLIDDTVNVEFSSVLNMGRFERFGYTAIQDPSTPGEGSFSGFCVWDMAKRKLHKKLYYQDGEAGGEPILIPYGDQILVGVYLQRGDDESFFCLYDGETTELITRLKMPYRVPFGFHGLWINGDELQGHFEHHEAKSNIGAGMDDAVVKPSVAAVGAGVS